MINFGVFFQDSQKFVSQCIIHKEPQKEGDSEKGTLTKASSIASPGQSQNWKILIHKKNAKESCQEFCSTVEQTSSLHLSDFQTNLN
ncbi:hypothetical protein LBBP_02919 [Leptospira borgpetersenii serovar Ballum]|uniref:Uncharacterized protein n=1 Tax=Leptospira borgpetersenii serovar Ballum TaxID=280505 RepID=A0A0S2ITZ9_LEPBO|nr:hypothetical protein LBBP_02919 [Leptospira borgpetersenii serovar Ballum]